jgi:Reverse transcriptase (RNA-dependent DNA polymerase).
MISKNLKQYKLSFACKRFISSYQHGFVHQRSTVTNLLSYQHDILQSFESGHCVHSVYTDVAKAFDRVDSRLLIAKLKSYGVGDSFLRWLSDYLSGRTQQVRLGNSLSSSINVLSGVGQGSHIGPLLFSLFFNDLPDVICHSSVLMFADDVKLYKSITCPEDYLLLQRDLDRFSEWLSLNGMELSLHKCFVMEFSRSKGMRPFIYHLNSVPLQHVSQMKDLGIIFDRNLSFIPQISNLSMRCFRILGYIFRNSKGLSADSFSLLYKSLVRSLLEYACVVWSPYYEVHCNTLDRVQKKFLSYFRYRFPHRNSNLDSLVDRRKNADIKFIEKLIEGQVDCAKLLELLTFDCTRRLTRCKTFKTNTYSTNYANNAPIIRMMKLCNEL